MSLTPKQVNPPNPTGKGGFRDNPENRNDGRWGKENSFSYWYNFFKHLTVEELKQWYDDNPENKRTVASDLAYRRVLNSQVDLKEFQEVADRSEGKAKQQIEHTGDTESPIKILLDRYGIKEGESIGELPESKDSTSTSST